MSILSQAQTMRPKQSKQLTGAQGGFGGPSEEETPCFSAVQQLCCVIEKGPDAAALGRTASRCPQAPQVPRKHGGIPRTTLTAELPETECRRGKPRGCKQGRQGTYEWPVAGMKYIQQCTRVSGIRFFRLMLISSCRYFSYWSLMNFMMGCQLQRERGTWDYGFV